MSIVAGGPGKQAGTGRTAAAQPPVAPLCSAHIRGGPATVSICQLLNPKHREAPLFRSVLTLRASAGRAGDLEAFYAENRVLERALAFPGCRAAELLRSVDDSPATHLVTADWDTAADYGRWVADPWRASLSEGLTALLDIRDDEPLVGGVFELVEPVLSSSSVPVNEEHQ